MGYLQNGTKVFVNKKWEKAVKTRNGKKQLKQEVRKWNRYKAGLYKKVRSLLFLESEDE